MSMFFSSSLVSSWRLIINMRQKLGFSMFNCVVLASASLEERGHRLTILYVWNIISSEFFFFSIHFECQILDAKSK